jgi:hypothetical protein
MSELATAPEANTNNLGTYASLNRRQQFARGPTYEKQEFSTAEFHHQTCEEQGESTSLLPLGYL